jgi:DNA mismatch repair protein MSH6
MDHPEYDATTLFIPQDFIKKATPAMQQYWNFKTDNFDKVLFFKLGKFYELFYDDAIVGNKVLDLNWMGNDPGRLHVGFPEKVLEEKAYQLIQSGFKVAVIEQVETPQEMEVRLKEQTKSTKADKCIKRELCNVFTKGTFIFESEKTENKVSYNNRFCIALYCKEKDNENKENKDKDKDKDRVNNYNDNDEDNYNNNHNKNYKTFYEWNFLIWDVTTLDFYFGRIEFDDENFTKIKTLLYNINPQEIIIQRNNIENYMENFMSSLSSNPQITKMKPGFSMLILFNLTNKYFGENKTNWDKLLINYINEENEGMLNVIFNSITYLEKLLLAEQILKIAKFSIFNSNMIFNKNLILDYQTITNLEIIETKLDPKNKEAGSLMEFLNQSVTNFGKRKMREWILNPLIEKSEIENRLFMVDDIINNFDFVTIFRSHVGKFVDFERLVTKIYKFSMQNNTKAVYFEDFSKTRIKEFIKTVNSLKNSMELFKNLNRFVQNFNSKNLQKKLIFEGEEIPANKNNEIKKDNNNDSDFEFGEVVNIEKTLKEIEGYYIESKNENGDLIFQPRTNICKDHDLITKEIEKIKNKFEDILNEEKKRLKCPLVTYVHTKNYKYELEIPADMTKNKSLGSRYKLTTSRKGYMRYHTDEIEELIQEYESLLISLKKENYKFNIFLFEIFYSKSKEINKYISNIAELDCLVSLAFISAQVFIF